MSRADEDAMTAKIKLRDAVRWREENPDRADMGATLHAGEAAACLAAFEDAAAYRALPRDAASGEIIGTKR